MKPFHSFHSCALITLIAGVAVHAGERSAQEQTDAANRLITRVIPKIAEYFHINVEPKEDGTEFFSLRKAKDNRIIITSSSGVTGAWALNHYLKYYCHAQISWNSGVELDQIPLEILPDVDLELKITKSFRYRYLSNVVTFSYSYVWWKWKEWEKFIDWMALNGINLPLATTAFEATLDKVFESFGASEVTRRNFFTGPAFLAWGRMGNLKSWAGPLPEYWLADQMQLQTSILDRARSLGMKPVLPCFPGFVPEEIIRANPGASAERLGSWVGFACPNYSCIYLLDPSSDLYVKMGAAFLRQLIADFGTDHLYSCDLFNENGIPAGVQPLEYLDSVGKGVHKSLTAVDPDAVWVMQGWTFENDGWSPEFAKALLTSIPPGKMIILDLYAEMFPQYPRLESFFGQPFIFCLLNNFGGRKGMFGDIRDIIEGPKSALEFPNSTFAGIGVAPEGIHSNYVLYDVFLELPLLLSPDPENVVIDAIEWTHQYGIRRYGLGQQLGRNGNPDGVGLSNVTWTILSNAVYTAHPKLPPHGHPVIAKRPSLELQPFIWYPPASIWEAWEHLISLAYTIELAGGSLTPGFREDLVDVGRQCLEVQIDLLYVMILDAFHAKNVRGVLEKGTSLLQTIEGMDALLKTDGNYLLGRWLRQAERWAFDKKYEEPLRFNALNQITWWGPNAEILDYAFKQWSGVISYYALPRWEAFLQYLVTCLATGKSYAQNEFNDIASVLELEFVTNARFYPSQPEADPVRVSKELFQRWKPSVEE